MEANFNTLNGFKTARLGLFDFDMLGDPPAPRMAPSVPLPSSTVNYNLPSALLPPSITYSAPRTSVSVLPPITATPTFIPQAPTTFDKVADIVANVVGAFTKNPTYNPRSSYSDYARTQQTGIAASAAEQAAFAQTQAGNLSLVSGGAGADTGANVGAAVGNIGDQIFGVIMRNPFATLLVGAGALLLFLPSPRRR